MSPALFSASILLADGWSMHDGGAGWWVLMVPFWGLVIAGVIWLARDLGGRRQDDRRSDALGILDRRLAAGEISLEEYEERRAVLGARAPGTTTG